jgi:hypothetical protein
MHNPNWKRILMGGMVAAMMACGGPGPNPSGGGGGGGAGGGSSGQSLASVLSAGGQLPDPQQKPLGADGSPSEVIESYGQNGDWSCTEQKYTAETAPQDMATFEPNADVIWPGSLLQGGTLQSGAPEPIAVKRAGGTVLMNLVNTAAGATAKSYQMKLDEMTQGNVIDAQNAILANNMGGTPAAFDFEAQRVDSQEELAFAMNANVSWLTGSVDASLKFSSDQRYTRYLVKLTQRYYTMVYQTPTSVDEIFAPSVTGDQLAQYVGPNNPATYISAVTYGRQFYLLLESTTSAQNVEAALHGVYSGAFADASFDASSSYAKTQSQTTVHVFAVGGGAENALQAALSADSGQLDALRGFIAAGATIDGSNPGVPMSYEVRRVGDNALVKVGVATEFVRKSCAPVIKTQNAALWLDATTLTAPASLPAIYTWPGRTTTQNDGTGRGLYYANGINGHPAVWLNYSSVFNGWSYFDVNLAGGAVVGTDYTVVSVIRAAGEDLKAGDHSENYGQAIFLQGNDQNWDRNLHLGFEQAGTVVHGHWDYDLRSQSLPNPSGDVMTFRFSAADGKVDSQNGVQIGAAHDQTTSLSGNSGARIGANFSGCDAYIGEVRVYPTALSPLEQKTVECELGAKWSIGVRGCVNGKPDPALMQY